MQARKPEAQHVNRVSLVGAIAKIAGTTITTFLFIAVAVGIAGNAEFQLEVVFLWAAFFEVVHHHAGVVHVPLGISAVSFNVILNGAGDLLLPFLEKCHLALHNRLFVGEG
jgi:hypothetical protein